MTGPLPTFWNPYLREKALRAPNRCESCRPHLTWTVSATSRHLEPPCALSEGQLLLAWVTLLLLLLTCHSRAPVLQESLPLVLFGCHSCRDPDGSFLSQSRL